MTPAVGVGQGFPAVDEGVDVRRFVDICLVASLIRILVLTNVPLPARASVCVDRIDIIDVDDILLCRVQRIDLGLGGFFGCARGGKRW